MRTKTTKSGSLPFVILATIIAAVILAICLTQKNTAPRLLNPPTDADKCIDALFANVSLCDYEGVSDCLWGQPQLNIQADVSSGEGLLLYAFCSSVEYTPVGEWCPTDTGVSRTIQLRSRKIPHMIGLYQERAAELLEAAVNESARESVFSEDGKFLPDFLQGVERIAAADAVSGGQMVEQTLTINLVFDKGQWQIIPNEALLEAISGGIVY